MRLARKPLAAVAALLLTGGANGTAWGMQAGQEAQRVSLGQAINLALATSPLLDAAEAGLRVADQQVREAWGTLLPDVSVSASYARNLKLQQIFLPARFLDPSAPPGAVTPITVGLDNNWAAGLSATQKLFEMTALVGVGAAGRFRAVQEELVRGTAQQVVSNVRQAYFDALLAQEELRLTEQTIARVRRTLAETRARHRAGLVSDYEVLRFEVELANLEANLERVGNTVAAAKRTLLIEIGLDVETTIALEGRLDAIDLTDPTTNDAVSQELLRAAGAWGAEGQPSAALVQVALRRRSDVRQLRSQVLLEEARVGAARAEFFPKLSLFSNYNLTAQEGGAPSFFGEGPTSRVTTAAAGLRVEVPVFSGFSRAARVEQAEAAVRQREARLARVELQVRNEVRTLLDQAHEARRRAEAQRKAVAQAQRGYEIASAEYREGVGSQLQLTDAEVALRESEFNYARAVHDYLSARARLEFALGLVPDQAGAPGDDHDG